MSPLARFESNYKQPNYKSNSARMSGSSEKPKKPISEMDLGDSMIFSWKVDETSKISVSSKYCIHVLQANGGLITNCYSKKALTLPKSNTFGNCL